MLIAEVHFQQETARSILLGALSAAIDRIDDQPVFVCIGSDRHLLDCLGPLTGTMLHSLVPGLPILGTLDSPLHAQNLVAGIKSIREAQGKRMIVAIDASAGQEDEIGLLRIKEGGLVPGKALAKNLPSVGQLSITGVVDTRLSLRGIRTQRRPGLSMIYSMAQILSSTISEWYINRYPA